MVPGMSLSTLPTLPGVEHAYVDLPGLRMHVAEAGAGEPVLLLHGFPQHWWEWRGVIPRLAPHYRVIAPDLRGAGWTDTPAEGYTSEQQRADVPALLDHLGLDRVRLVGHAWSAIVGFQLAIQHPERIQQYVSLSVPHPWFRFPPAILGGAWRLWFMPVIATPGLGARLLGRGNHPSRGPTWRTKGQIGSPTGSSPSSARPDPGPGPVGGLPFQG